MGSILEIPNDTEKNRQDFLPVQKLLLRQQQLRRCVRYESADFDQLSRRAVIAVVGKDRKPKKKGWEEDKGIEGRAMAEHNCYKDY